MRKNKAFFRRASVIRRGLLGCLVILLLIPVPDSSLLAANHAQEETFGVLCALPSEFIIGQPHEYPGGTSGTTRSLGDTQELGLVDYTTFFLPEDPSRFGNFDMLQGHITAFNRGVVPDHDVAILILDDFSVRQAKNQLMSHGEYVFEVAQRLLSAQLPPTPFQEATPGAYREVHYLDGHLKLIAIDGPGYDLHQMFTDLNGIMTNLRTAAQNRPVYFVVNMSFAMFPCDWLQETTGSEALGFTVVAGEQYPFPHDHDLIVPYDDPSSPRDPLRPDDQTLWQVTDGNSSEFTNKEILSGDIIEAFNFTDSNDPNSWLSLNMNSLLGLLLSADDNTQLVGIRTRGGNEFWVPPIALYKALQGDSVAMRRAEIALQNAGISPDQVLPRWLAKALGQQRALLSQELRLDPQSVWPPIPISYPENTFMIAAAGNFDGIAPLYPAVFDNVISVAGSITGQEFDVYQSNGASAHVTLDSTVTRWPDSNSGQLMAPAGWYPIAVGRQSEYISGTSFAAPATSVLIGLSLLQGSCSPLGTAVIPTWADNHAFFFHAYCRDLP